MKTRAPKTVSLLLLVVVTLTACTSTSQPYKRGLVYRDWTRTFSELGIFPVFPPREDVLPGDVWLLPTHPYDTRGIEAFGGLGKVGLWYDRLTVNKTFRDALTENYAKIPYPADTKNGTALAADTTKATVIGVPAYTNATENLFIKGLINKTRQVAFPEFAATTVDQGSLSALIPIEMFALSGAASWSNVNSVSIKIPQAESYGIPIREVLDQKIEGSNLPIKELFKDYSESNRVLNLAASGDLDLETLRVAKIGFDDSLNYLRHSTESHSERTTIALLERDTKNKVWLSLVTEVFLARAIDVTVSSSSALSSTASAEPLSAQQLASLNQLKTPTTTAATAPTGDGAPADPAPAAPAPAAPAAPAAGSTTEGSTSGDPGMFPIPEFSDEGLADVLKLAVAVNEYNAKVAANQTSIGGTLSITSASSSAVGLRRTFERPIVVGIRGVVVEVDLEQQQAYQASR